MADDKKPKKFTALELAGTAVKAMAEAAGKKVAGRGSAGNAADVLKRRSASGGEGITDAETYRRRQYSDSNN